MTWIAELVDPAFLDGVLVLMVAELVLGIRWLRARGGERWIAPLLLYLSSGAALIVALRQALAGAHAGTIALALSVSGIAQVVFLLRCRAVIFPRTRLPHR